jgi:hypothetical protein
MAKRGPTSSFAAALAAQPPTLPYLVGVLEGGLGGDTGLHEVL